jgi:hypothetical protein
MTDEPSSDPIPEPDKPIALGGPSGATPRGAGVEPGEEPMRATVPADPEPEHTPEPEARQVYPRVADRTTEAAPAYPASGPVPQKRSVAMPVLGVLGFVILAAAIGYLWVRPEPVPQMPAMPPDESHAVTALQSDVATLKTRLAALDKRETSDVSALQKTIAALPASAPAAPQSGASTSQPSVPSPPPTSNSTPAQSATPSASAPAVAQAAPDDALNQKVAGLSDSLKQLQAAETAQAQQTQSLPSAADVSNLASRVDTVAQRESKDDSAIRQDLSLVQQQLATLSGQAQTLTKNSAALPKLTAQADRLGQIVRAQEALRAGLPLGTIANAPPALTRFADTAPPTEAALRLSFANDAQVADKAGEPTPDQGHFWHRVWLRVQNLVMVRQGDHVVLGDPTSAILAHAQTVLDAGDLSGTLKVLETLTGPAAQAMAPWEAQAQALLQARQALTQMAAG